MTGDAVNTAARLQTLAPLDGVVTGEATYAATARLFRWGGASARRAEGQGGPAVQNPRTAPGAYSMGTGGRPSAMRSSFAAADAFTLASSASAMLSFHSSHVFDVVAER